MPKRNDIESILILGAGPIVIGQACEFDYSGAQACKALREEGYRVILVNSNPATIMTDPAMADATYIEPMEWQTVSRIIERERRMPSCRPWAGRPRSTARWTWPRGCAGAQFGVEMIGATKEAIDKAEDRDLFARRCGVSAWRCREPAGALLEEASQVQESIGFPCIIRPSFTMGGSGGGIAYNREEFERSVCAAGIVADLRTADRGVADRLERVRDGGGARPQRQLHHRLLDREFRRHGRAHRRLDHRRARADADRQGIPDHARRLAGGAARDRRRNRWLERPVRSTRIPGAWW
jgi:hypothetical protein